MAEFTTYTDGSLDAAIRECLAVQWDIINGVIPAKWQMATKSAVEDVLLARHPNTERAYWHNLLNTIEYHNWKPRKEQHDSE